MRNKGTKGDSGECGKRGWRRCLLSAVVLIHAPVTVTFLPGVAASENVLFDRFSFKLQLPPPKSSSRPSSPSSPPRVDPRASLRSLGLDSLDEVELMVAIEREFHVELTDEVNESIQCVEDIVNQVQSLPQAY